METEIETQIPLFRAKKVGSNEYVIGWFKISPLGNPLIIETILYGPTQNEPLGGATELVHQIDISTLAIHHPEMIDSAGEKIFASLNKSRKGGDTMQITWSKPWLEESDPNRSEIVVYVCVFKNLKAYWESIESQNETREFSKDFPEDITGIQE